MQDLGKRMAGLAITPVDPRTLLALGVVLAALLSTAAAAAQPSTAPAAQSAPGVSEPGRGPGAEAVPEAEALAEPRPPPPVVVDDVTVGGRARQAAVAQDGSERLGAKDVGRMPGAFGDAFRAVEVLPGVAPMASGMPHLFVRGATPSASGYYVDDIEVPFLFHLAVGPSVINPAIIDDVVLYPGAFPAELGRHVGGIVAATTRPPAEQLRLEASLRLFDAGAYAEVPIDAIDVGAFGAFRYSYLAPLLSVFAPDTALSYWDYQAGAYHQLSRRDRIGVLAFGSRDHLGKISEDDTETELFGAELHRVQVRLERTARPRGAAADAPLGATARAAFTFGYDRSGISDQGEMRGRSYALTSRAEVPIASWLRARGGLDLRAEELTFESRRAPEPEPDPNAEDEGATDGELNFDINKAFASRPVGTMGAWLDLLVDPFDWLRIVPGFRTDLFAEPGATQVGLDPRGRVRISPTPWLALVSAAGLTHQRPALLVAVPGIHPVGLATGLQEALQLSQGTELSLPESVSASLTGFYHHYGDITDITATCSAGVPDCTIDDRSDGRAWGLEILLQRPLSHRVGGAISYTFSRSERVARERLFTADFDRTHVFNAAIGVDLGRHWNAGARLTVYSGRPHSLIAFDDPNEPNHATLIGQRNTLRRPSFHRLDLRLEKRWIIAERGWVSFVIEGYNVTLQREIVDFDCRVAEVLGSQAGLRCGGQEVGPISIPSIGVSGGI